jgi:hypothetical protein
MAHGAFRALITDSELRRRRNSEARFRICRREGSKLDIEIGRFPWEDIDTCYRCGVSVVYDRRDSEGLAHICPPCAVWYRNHGLKALQAMDTDPITERDLGDQEQLAKIAVSVSQSRHGEHDRKVGPPPSYNPAAGATARKERT